MIKEDTKTLLKFNAEGIHPGEMFFNARQEAKKAVDAYVEKYGEPMYCGFANVSIHPAQGRFVRYMKQMKIGSNGYRGGWRIPYNDIMPKDHPYLHTQSMSIREIACDAFKDELEKYGLTVYSESRGD